MLDIQGVFEIAVPVRDLQTAERFYCDVLGLKPALRDEERDWLFLDAGERAGMVVLQQRPEAEVLPMRFAFRVHPSDLPRSTQALKDHGVETHGPVHHDWMNADSLYFADPDGHALELYAPLG